MKKSLKSAFSLIELSIVILVIGILIAGVVAGSQLMSKADLASARALTKASPVNGIKDLLIWYETSLQSSFSDSEAVDAAKISTWYDNNPQSPFKINATQGTDANKPTFVENLFSNGVPGVRFDSSSKYLGFDLSKIAKTNYTVFVVERLEAQPDGDIWGLIRANGYLQMYYRASGNVGYDHWDNSGWPAYDWPDFSSPTPRMHTFLFDSTLASNNRKYWANGGNTSYDMSSSLSAAISSGITTATLGGEYMGSYGEVIIFTRALKTEERQAIESYLSKKFKITIS